jgi:hypothetical protein
VPACHLFLFLPEELCSEGIGRAIASYHPGDRPRGSKDLASVRFHRSQIRKSGDVTTPPDTRSVEWVRELVDPHLDCDDQEGSCLTRWSPPINRGLLGTQEKCSGIHCRIDEKIETPNHEEENTE